MTKRHRTTWSPLAGAGLLLVLLAVACNPPGAPAETPDGSTSAPQQGDPPPGAAAADPAASDSQGQGPTLVVPEQFKTLWKPWTGDLDGIAERRVLRMLVTFNATNYFVDLGKQGGVTYEAGEILQKDLNRRFKEGNLALNVVFIPVTRDQLFPALVEGHGDIAAASLTITKEREEVVDFTEPLTKAFEEIVVTGPGAPPVSRVEDLAGQQVHVRASSSYAESLATLNDSFAERGLEPVKVVPVDERLETEDILEMANAGVFPITVADSYLADLWSKVLDQIHLHPAVTLRTGARLGWAIRKGSPKLKAFLDDFARKNRQGTLMGNIILNRYYKTTKWIEHPGKQGDIERFQSMVDLFRKYADQYDFDYLMVVAQAYQESGLDQSRRSAAGAVGVMQLLPSTARDPNVGIADITTVENNIHAGVKYMRFILDRYFGDADMDDLDRHLFAFASYNAGPARVAGLRQKAAAMGLDPNKWRGNVEVVAAREIGRETVQYVSNIFKYYVAYKLIQERQAERSKLMSGA